MLYKINFYAFYLFYLYFHICIFFFYNVDEDRLSVVCINISKMLMWQGLEKTCNGIFFIDQFWVHEYWVFEVINFEIQLLPKKFHMCFNMLYNTTVMCKKFRLTKNMFCLIQWNQIPGIIGFVGHNICNHVATIG